MSKINESHRVYQLQPKDIFSIELQNFLKEFTFENLAEQIAWCRNFQILGINEYKRRRYWWQLWIPRKTVVVRIMYLRGDKDEQN